MIGGYAPICQLLARPQLKVIETETEAIQAAAIEANLLMQLYETDWPGDFDHAFRARPGQTQELWRSMLEYASDQRLARLEAADGF